MSTDKSELGRPFRAPVYWRRLPRALPWTVAADVCMIRRVNTSRDLDRPFRALISLVRTPRALPWAAIGHAVGVEYHAPKVQNDCSEGQRPGRFEPGSPFGRRQLYNFQLELYNDRPQLHNLWSELYNLWPNFTISRPKGASYRSPGQRPGFHPPPIQEP